MSAVLLQYRVPRARCIMRTLDRSHFRARNRSIHQTQQSLQSVWMAATAMTATREAMNRICTVRKRRVECCTPVSTNEIKSRRKNLPNKHDLSDEKQDEFCVILTIACDWEARRLREKYLGTLSFEARLLARSCVGAGPICIYIHMNLSDLLREFFDVFYSSILCSLS